MLEIPWIACRPGIEIGEDSSDGFPKNDRARLFQLGDGLSILFRNEVLEEGRAHRCPEAFRVKDVLDSNRNTVKRTAKLLSISFYFQFAGLGQDRLSIDGDPCLQPRLNRVDSVEQAGYVIDWGEIAGSNAFSSVCQGKIFKVHLLTLRAWSGAPEDPSRVGRGPAEVRPPWSSRLFLQLL